MKRSKKQQEVFDFAHTTGTFLLCCGSVRSGKSLSNLIAYWYYTQSQTQSFDHLITGRKARVVQIRDLPILKALAEYDNVPYSYNGYEDKWQFGDQGYILAAANDESSADRIQGLTCHSMYGDEVALWPESFFNMATTRLSYETSKAFLNCNPENPSHWLKVNWIDVDKIDKYLTFYMEDNPSLDEEYIERTKSLYTGVFYQRFVLGLWAAAEGIIHPIFHLTKDTDDYIPIDLHYAVDYGITAPTAICVLLRERKGRHTRSRVLETIEMISSPSNHLTDEDISEFLVSQQDQYKLPIKSLVLDPSAVSLRNSLTRKKGRKFHVVNGKNDVIPGIRTTDTALVNKDIVLDDSIRTHHLQNELAAYAWDPDKRDEPLKENDHWCNALRYYAMRFHTSFLTELPKRPI